MQEGSTEPARLSAETFSRETAGAGSEATVTLHPQPRTVLPRVVGPGRLERGYLERIETLDLRLERAEGSLEVAALVERGSARLIDRLEREEERARTELERARMEGNRLLVVLGAVQRDNERLHERARELEMRLAALAPPRRIGIFARLRAMVHPRA